jgi:hypothetical protein
MATGSGLDGQIGFAQETTWGTAVTVTRFPEFNSEGISLDTTWLEPTALRPSVYHKRGNRAQPSRYTVTGDFELDIVTLGMGMFVRNMLGSSTATTTLVSGTAYKQIHVPGGYVGLGLTAQVGRPEPSGTVRPFTFAGCKIPKWELSLKDNATPKLKFTVDGKSESTATALATPTYLSGASVFTFRQASIKLGGTAATASGETTITGGVAPTTIIKDISIAGANPMADDRYGIGNAGLKAEQLQNATPTITGKLGAEFNKTEFYDVYTAGTPTCLQFDLTGAVIGGANSYLFSVILPMVKFKKATPQVTGPDIVQMSTDFEAYSDETNPVCQIKIVSTEATAV